MGGGQAGAATPAGNQGRLQNHGIAGSWEDFLEEAQETMRTAKDPRLLLTIANEAASEPHSTPRSHV